jgi:hypothetical protein
MLAVLLLLTSTFATEASATIGKQSVRVRRENVHDMSFLGLFWALVFLLGTLSFGARWHFDPASLPTLSIRLVLEIALAYLNSEATIEADRSTFGFLRLLTIPLILIVDIALGYHMSLIQVAGVALMFVALILAFRHNRRGRRGAWVAVLSAITAVGTLSLNKYDITHYNSVVAEQTIVLAGIFVFYYIMARRGGRSPLKLLIKPITGTQSLANGTAIALESFAISLVPASIIVTLKRCLALMWAIIFGGMYFHEHSLKRKISSAALLAVSLALIAGPTLIHL